jgi:hypothetical protein
LRAYVVKSSGAKVDEQTLKDHVKSNLARYKVPREIVFIDEMPRNPAGKIVKRELPVPDGGGGGKDEGAKDGEDKPTGKKQPAKKAAAKKTPAKKAT